VSRLLYSIAFTTNMSAMKTFYRDRVGLHVDYETSNWVEFESAPGAARLGLLAVKSTVPREIELCFETSDIEQAAEERSRRGVSFVDNIRDQAFGKIIHARDPEGNLLTILQPRPRDAVAAGATWASRGRNAVSGSSIDDVSGGTATAVATTAPTLSTAIINCRSMVTTRAFYHNGWGLPITNDSSWWVEFDSGDTVIALHPRIDVPDREHHHGQRVTLGFSVENLRDWVDEARERGMPFATSPLDEGFGLYAEVTDPEGNVIVFREPPAGRSSAEELAEPFEDETVPRKAAIRKPVGKGVGVSRLVPRTSSTAKKAASTRRKPKSASAKPRRIPSVRGGGPEGARLTPKRKSDPKRARNRPAVGRLKKAERRTIKVHKRAVAASSKGRPVKRAVAGRRK